MALKTYLTAEELTRMIDAAVCNRDKVILSFYIDTGCRVSELLKIKVEDVDLDEGVVLIPHLKRGTHKKCPGCGKMAGRRTAFCPKCGYDLSSVAPAGIEERSRLLNIGEKTCSLLRQYINDSKVEGQLINLSRQHVYNIVREAAAAIGLDGKKILNPETGKKHHVHPHLFRTSLAVDWLGYAGNDVGRQKALQEHLGHKNFATTMKYMKLAPSAVKKIGDEVRGRRFEELPSKPAAPA